MNVQTATPRTKKPAKPRVRAKTSPGKKSAAKPDRKLTSVIAEKLTQTGLDQNRQLTNHIAFVIDRSGSMQNLREPVVKAFNGNLQAIKSEVFKNTTKDGKSDQDTTLTSVFFDHRVDTQFVAKPIDSLKSMSIDDYRPDGGTALLQAVGETIQSLERLPDAQARDTSFLVVVITDGEERDTRGRWQHELPEKIRECQATDRWTFAFLLPDERAKTAFVRQFGVPAGNVSVWAATTEGTSRAGQSIIRGITGYYGARATGQKSVKGFFEVDASKIKKKDLAQLEDLAAGTRVLQVKSECEIKGFCEAETRAPYLKGAAFYELTKDETVQGYKKIAIMERGGRKVYGGGDARQLLGLGDDTIKIRIANLGAYKVFIQSTSVNRKLVRGTSVLYIPGLA